MGAVGERVQRRGRASTGDRITAVGPAAQVQAPAGTRALDLTRRTILPAFIDLHAHHLLDATQWQGDLHHGRNPHLLASIAYGVTTWRDPSIRRQTLFALAGMVEAGTTAGPRIHGTGDIFISFDLL